MKLFDLLEGNSWKVASVLLTLQSGASDFFPSENDSLDLAIEVVEKHSSFSPLVHARASRLKIP